MKNENKFGYIDSVGFFFIDMYDYAFIKTIFRKWENETWGDLIASV